MATEGLDLEAIEARANAATHGAELSRYGHGGGRLAVLDDDGSRKLVADFYHVEDREFYVRALADTYDLVDALRAARQLVGELEASYARVDRIATEQEEAIMMQAKRLAALEGERETIGRLVRAVSARGHVTDSLDVADLAAVLLVLDPATPAAPEGA